MQLSRFEDCTNEKNLVLELFMSGDFYARVPALYEARSSDCSVVCLTSYREQTGRD
jgi:hypothetical protein